MTYQEALESVEWFKKREHIIARDHFCCQKCGKKRSPFRGTCQSFGTLYFHQLKDKGITLTRNKPLDYNHLFYKRNGREDKASFIGNWSRPFDITTLLFTLRNSKEVLFGKTLRVEQTLVCFYAEDKEEHNLADLNVHHTYYIEGKKPWEYEDNSLITLCVDCHRKEHGLKNVVVYSKEGEKLHTAKICFKCYGSGYLEKYHYYMDGVCFICWGNGVLIKEANDIQTIGQ